MAWVTRSRRGTARTLTNRSLGNPAESDMLLTCGYSESGIHECNAHSTLIRQRASVWRIHIAI